MNDATAIVLFGILLGLLAEPHFSLEDGMQAVSHFFDSFEFQVGKQLAFTLEKSSFPVNK